MNEISPPTCIYFSPNVKQVTLLGVEAHPPVQNCVLNNSLGIYNTVIIVF